MSARRERGPLGSDRDSGAHGQPEGASSCSAQTKIGLPWSRRGDDLVLSVRLTPKSARDEIAGLGCLSDGRPILRVRVRALPQDGAANEALVKVVAKALRLPTTAVHLETGSTGRVKTLRLTGDTAVLQSDLARMSGLV